MENGNGGLNLQISSGDVISKLKDDGDFDNLRLKIIRKLKDNEELRKKIMSIVTQSVAINRPGFENMKPRQLSDSIFQEVGEKLNEQISDGLWEIIRSPDGMKSEITETVKTVYKKLLRPKRDENAETSGRYPKRIRNEHDHHKSSITPVDEINVISESEPKEPSSHQIDIINPVLVQNLPMEEQQKTTLHRSQEVLTNDNKEQGDGSDDDPDAPPGFG